MSGFEIVLLIGIVICILFSAFFSSSEMSFSSANKVRLENAADEGSEVAKLALKIMDNFDDALSTILVGNNLVNIASSSMASVFVILLFGESYTWVATLVLTILVIIFGETIPKISAKKNATRYAMTFSKPIQFLMYILKPITFIVVKLCDLITKNLQGENSDNDAAVEELHSIIETAEDESVLDEDSSELVSAAIDFADISVSEVMTARVDIIALDVEETKEEILEKINNCPFSRIPVYEDSIDHIIGILSLNHFLKAALDQEEVDLRSLLMQPYYVYKTMKLPSVLETLRDSQQHLAIVSDEYGGTLGVVSLEDVLEQLVGDIWDETDIVDEDIVVIDEDTLHIDGDTSVSDLIELMHWKEEDFDYESETVGGWCIEYLEEFPKEGQSFTYQNAKFVVMKVDERRVLDVEVELLKEEEEE
ncbi:MAG: HlyC/CorC family transporter [Solobacterium sp.]|nr:HlyC/CorC family transporter [Solobacterium sp.]